MKNTAEINKETTFQLKTFWGIKDVLVEPDDNQSVVFSDVFQTRC